MDRHFTATAYIIENQKVLLLFHSKIKKWLPPGGHMEPDETPPEAARREALEETGLEIAIIPQENLWLHHWNAKSFERPYLCLLENIPEHQGVAAHQHIDFIYLARPCGGSLNSEARWFSLEEIEQLETDVTIFGETQKTIRHILNPK